MKYVVFTTKHHDGFCLFDNPLTDYKVTNTPRRAGLHHGSTSRRSAPGAKVGFYYSLIDWHHPEYAICDTHPLWVDAERRRAAVATPITSTGRWRRSLRNTARVDLLWFDFTTTRPAEQWRAEELLAMVRRLQPNVVIDDRLDYARAARARPALRPGRLRLARADHPGQGVPTRGRPVLGGWSP